MNRPLLIAAAGLVVVGIAVFLAVDRTREDKAPSLPPAPSVDSPPPSAAAPARPESKDPSFDVVRVGEKGDTVIAGRAMPKADVLIFDGDREIGRTIADNRGEWVFVPDKPLQPGTHELRLKAENPDGSKTNSGAPVVLVVPERGAAVALKPLPGGGAKLLQAPAGNSGPVSVDLVDRDESGRLYVGGRSTAGGTVQVYLDNAPFGRATADEDGGWQVAGTAPKNGRHILRADLLDKAGKVVARVELEYNPEDDLSISPDGKIKVARGNSLWRIARKLYGAGAAYSVIYEANKDLIRDPNLIYPGQVFELPKR